MKISDGAGELKRFRRAAMQCKHQQTFQTPLQQLGPFVASILAATGPLESGVTTIEQVVFEPRNLHALLAQYSVITEPVDENYLHGRCIEAVGDNEIEALLVAILGSWIDFAFVPKPKSFMIYADHDEYVTFFAARKSPLSLIATSLSEQGFRKVDYERRF
jgi:hypothetical protein